VWECVTAKHRQQQQYQGWQERRRTNRAETKPLCPNARVPQHVGQNHRLVCENTGRRKSSAAYNLLNRDAFTPLTYENSDDIPRPNLYAYQIMCSTMLCRSQILRNIWARADLPQHPGNALSPWSFGHRDVELLR
jgi:hypothetical protein